MNDQRNKFVPPPPNLRRGYVPGHQVTLNYLEGMRAINENRLKDAIVILEKEPTDSSCRGLAIGNAGLALLRLEKFELADEKLLEADDNFNQHGCPHPPSWVQFARNHAEAIARSRPQEALRRFNRAISAARNLIEKHAEFHKDIELEIAHIFGSWGGTLIRLETPDAALDCFEEAREIYKKHGPENKAGLAETLTNVSLALRCIGKKYEASLAIQEALDVARSGGDQDQIRRIEISTIQLNPTLIDGDPLDLLDNAAKEAIVDGRYSTGYVRQCIRAKVAEKLGDISTALMACNDAREIEPRLDLGDLSPAQMRLTLAHLLVANGSPQSEILNALFEGGRLWWAQLGMEQLPADLKLKSQSMHDHFRFLARKLVDENRSEEACMVFEAGRGLSFGLEVDESALPKILALNPFGASDNSVNCSGLQKTQVALMENQVVLSLAILPPDLVAFIIRTDSVEVITHSLPCENESISMFNSIREIPRRLDTKGGIQAIPEVIQDFATKISNEIAESSVISVIPNSILHNVPWRALLRSLGIDWSRLPTVTEFGLFLGKRKSNAISEGVIALGHGSAGALDLNQEARDFANAFGERGSVIENAGSADIRGALIQRGVVLVSCHGCQRMDWNLETHFLYLELKDGDILADDVWPDTVNACCIVLSACDSGVYEMARGDYPIGAGPDLLRKGAEFCLATRFPVNALFAANLMKEFATQLSSGESIQASFGLALDTLEKNEADLWNELACFELIG